MSRIDQTNLDQMFTRAGVDKQKLYDSLRTMGLKEIRKDLRKYWTPDNPTRMFCYVIAEFVYHFVAVPDSQAFRLSIPAEPAEHSFVRWPDGALVDLAAEQFPDYSVVKYDEAKRPFPASVSIQAG
jgi:hypothetical protein